MRDSMDGQLCQFALFVLYNQSLPLFVQITALRCNK